MAWSSGIIAGYFQGRAKVVAGEHPSKTFKQGICLFALVLPPFRDDFSGFLQKNMLWQIQQI
jgi:hypothetical protein